MDEDANAYLFDQSSIETGDEGCQCIPFLVYLVDGARRFYLVESTRGQLLTELCFAALRMRIR